MNISVASKGKYDSIKAILLMVIAFFLGPSIYMVLMAAIDNGDSTKYLMLIGLLVFGIVLVLIYRLLTIEEGTLETDQKASKKFEKKAGKKTEKKVEEKPAEKIINLDDDEDDKESKSPKSADDSEE